MQLAVDAEGEPEEDARQEEPGAQANAQPLITQQQQPLSPDNTPKRLSVAAFAAKLGSPLKLSVSAAALPSSLPLFRKPSSASATIK